MSLSFAVLKPRCLDASLDSERSLSSKLFWPVLQARLIKQPWFLDTELHSLVMNKGYQENMTLRHLSDKNSIFSNFILKSFKPYCHFSKNDWKLYFIVMLTKWCFYKKQHCAIAKGLSLLFKKPGKLGVKKWSECSTFQKYRIKSLALLPLLSLFCQWFKMFSFTPADIDLLIPMCFLANSNKEDTSVRYTIWRLQYYNPVSCNYNYLHLKVFLFCWTLFKHVEMYSLWISNISKIRYHVATEAMAGLTVPLWICPILFFLPEFISYEYVRLKTFVWKGFVYSRSITAWSQNASASFILSNLLKLQF